MKPLKQQELLVGKFGPKPQFFQDTVHVALLGNSLAWTQLNYTLTLQRHFFQLLLNPLPFHPTSTLPLPLLPEICRIGSSF